MKIKVKFVSYNYLGVKLGEIDLLCENCDPKKVFQEYKNLIKITYPGSAYIKRKK